MFTIGHPTVEHAKNQFKTAIGRQIRLKNWNQNDAMNASGGRYKPNDWSRVVSGYPDFSLHKLIAMAEAIGCNVEINIRLCDGSSRTTKTGDKI